VIDGPSPTTTTTNQDQGEADVEGEVASRREPPQRVQVDHPASRIIGDMSEHTTRSRVRNNSHFSHIVFVATFEPKDIGHTLFDHNWVSSMGVENKEGEKGEVVRNKSKLVAQGFSQKEGIDYEETFPP
jgi:hypothetical protein